MPAKWKPRQQIDVQARAAALDLLAACKAQHDAIDILFAAEGQS